MCGDVHRGGVPCHPRLQPRTLRSHWFYYSIFAHLPGNAMIYRMRASSNKRACRECCSCKNYTLVMPKKLQCFIYSVHIFECITYARYSRYIYVDILKFMAFLRYIDHINWIDISIRSVCCYYTLLCSLEAAQAVSLQITATTTTHVHYTR